MGDYYNIIGCQILTLLLCCLLYVALFRLPDWTEMFPIHKFACEGDGEGISRCLQLGIDPDELDTDSWAPLHYACWYIHL